MIGLNVPGQLVCVLADAGCTGGTPLEAFPDKFLDQTGDLLICSTHGARFRVRDGFCIKGPCEGASLEQIPVEVTDGEVCLRNKFKPETA